MAGYELATLQLLFAVFKATWCRGTIHELAKPPLICKRNKPSCAAQNNYWALVNKPASLPYGVSVHGTLVKGLGNTPRYSGQTNEFDYVSLYHNLATCMHKIMLKGRVRVLIIC